MSHQPMVWSSPWECAHPYNNLCWPILCSQRNMFQRRFFETHETLTFLTMTDVLFTDSLRYNMTFAREKIFFVIAEKLERNVFSLGILFDKKNCHIDFPDPARNSSQNFQPIWLWKWNERALQSSRTSASFETHASRIKTICSGSKRAYWPNATGFLTDCTWIIALEPFVLGASLCFAKLNILKRERNYVYSLPTRKVRITRKLLSLVAHVLVQYVYDQICKLKTYTRPSEKSDNFELLDFLLNLAKGRRKSDFYI